MSLFYTKHPILVLMKLLLSFLVLFTTHSFGQEGIVSVECGLYNGCINDLSYFSRISSELMMNTKNIVLELAKEVNFSSENEEDDFQNLLKLNYETLRSCQESITLNCVYDVNEVDKEISKRLFFSYGQTKTGRDFWTKANKREVGNYIKRKICSGRVRLDKFKELDFINFQARKCIQSPREIPDFLKKKCSKYEINVSSNCAVGNHISKFNCGKNTQGLIFSAGLFFRAYSDYSQIFSDIDNAFLHEYVHLLRDVDPEFIRKSDNFLKMSKYEQKVQKYRQLSLKFEFDVINSIDELNRNESVSGEDRKERIMQSIKTLIHSYYKSLKDNNIVNRFSSSSRSRVFFNNVEQDSISGNLYLQFDKKTGKADKESFKFKAANFYPLKSKEEYIADAVTLFYFQRDRANDYFSEEELKWLQENWHLAYLK